MMQADWLRRGHRMARIATVAGTAVLLSGATAGAAVAAPGGAAVSRPAHGATVRPATRSDVMLSGWWEGTDSWPVNVTGAAPYQVPAIGGNYGGYIGMTGNWASREGCHGQVAWSSDNSHQANINYTTYHIGIGTGVYWFMGGPGVDPHYNGSTSEAAAWGVQQAEWTLYDMSKLQVTYPVVFEDVELPGIAPAPDNGWNSVYTSPCSGVVKSGYISADVDRAEFNGYADYITSHSKYKVGVYSSPSIWTSIFGTGSDASLTNTYEWTYNSDTSSLSRVPDQWCLSGTSTCADFFGGQNSGSPYALMWQWTGGGGTRNGFGDFDEIDYARMP
jgi:hypothetical protein